MLVSWTGSVPTNPGQSITGATPVDYGESLEKAAVREAKEETSLDVQLIEQFLTYSDPGRDPRHHTISTVFIAKAAGEPKGADDAKTARLFTENDLSSPVVFDHAQILADYFHYKNTGERPKILAEAK